jgi:tetratricopeptide (TPR) repeat protein
MYSKFTASTPGVDAEQDKVDEAGLSKLGGYTLMLWQYEKAANIFETAIDRYPNGANAYYNLYRLATCYDRMERYPEAVDALDTLMAHEAWTVDDRVPEFDNLNLKAAKLRGVHEIGV